MTHEGLQLQRRAAGGDGDPGSFESLPAPGDPGFPLKGFYNYLYYFGGSLFGIYEDASAFSQGLLQLSPAGGLLLSIPGAHKP